mmetsp:Transcript_16654/g.34159  ORF Transcript_16654/g.34159 Transcript_16654/m.34159 type:complete len:104 (+) Transcript_16654:282-593(+)
MISKKYHPNPGTPFQSGDRTAYLPNTSEGKDLLKRLKHAFSRGLTVTVGTCIATGLPDSIVWTSIQYKTSQRCGLHSYPNPCYISNCNSELNRLHVPHAQCLT